MNNIDLIGTVWSTKHSGSCTIVGVTNRKNLTVVFGDGYKTNCALRSLKLGNVLNPYCPKIYGVGFLGEGEYLAKVDGKISPFYDAWRGTLRRSYDASWLVRNPTYAGASVTADWHNYQTFCAWSESQKFEAGFKLDKDLLGNGDKVYSPSTCVYLPNELNCLIADHWREGRGLPRGVYKRAGNNRTGKIYAAAVRWIGRSRSWAYYCSAEEAGEAYKVAKEAYMKERALYWKGRIESRAFETLMLWELPK